MAAMKKTESAKSPASKAAPVGRAAGKARNGRPATPPVRISRAGTTLTPEYERELAAEAEAGYDLDHAVARPVGRPSLSNRPGPSRRIQARVSDEEYDALDRLARAHGERISTMLRGLVRDYLDQASSRRAS